MLLVDVLRHLALKLGAMRDYVGLSFLRLRLKDGTHPVADSFVLDSHLIGIGQDVMVDVGLGLADGLRLCRRCNDSRRNDNTGFQLRGFFAPVIEWPQ